MKMTRAEPTISISDENLIMIVVVIVTVIIIVFILVMIRDYRPFKTINNYEKIVSIIIHPRNRSGDVYCLFRR